MHFGKYQVHLELLKVGLIGPALTTAASFSWAGSYHQIGYFRSPMMGGVAAWR